MTYLGFHALFILPPIVLLALTQRRPMAGIGARRAWAYIGLLALIAFVYTTPWDNYLVYRGVWGYGSDRVLGTVGYVPIEEYLFFLLQPVLTGLWYARVRGLGPPRPPAPRWARPAGTSACLLLTLLGVFLLFSTRGLYLGLILAWASPVLAGMVWLCADRFWRARREWAVGIAVPTLYLWVADHIAIANGIWEISEVYTLGINPFGLPIEEATFFLVTNVLVVQGLMMFLPERSFSAITA